ncbi:MAG: response regulator transcription factor [Anaerolineales bacterium]|nr:response regulator transcription factor [Anaerolineales bacterium]
METIRILLVDDHDIVRTGLKTFLDTQKGLQVVSEASTGDEAITMAAQTQPDVVIMDITMPEMDGLVATSSLKEIDPDINVLALTVHEDKQYLFQMMSAGASGYLTKQSAAEELVEAIRAVAAGNVYLQPTLARWLLEDYRRMLQGLPSDSVSTGEPTGAAKDLDVLSKREKQVLELVAEGFTNIQIGEKLGISPKTVARHRERIMKKLDLHSCTELVKFAIRTGLIEI